MLKEADVVRHRRIVPRPTYGRILFVFFFLGGSLKSVTELPDFGGPTAEQWAAIRQAAESGGAERACEAAELDVRLARLFEAIAVADKICADAETAATGAVETNRDTLDKLRLLRQSQPGSVADVNAIGAEIKRVQAENEDAKLRLELSRIASVNRRGMRQTFPSYFAVSAHVVNGVPRFPSIRDAMPPTVAAELQRLKLPIDSVPEPWRHLEPIATTTKPARRVTTSQTFGKIKA